MSPKLAMAARVRDWVLSAKTSIGTVPIAISGLRTQSRTRPGHANIGGEGGHFSTFKRAIEARASGELRQAAMARLKASDTAKCPPRGVLKVQRLSPRGRKRAPQNGVSTPNFSRRLDGGWYHATRARGGGRRKRAPAGSWAQRLPCVITWPGVYLS